VTAPYVYDPTALRDVFERNFTLIAGFRRNVHRYARRLAMLDPVTSRAWTYRELGADVDRLAAGLAGLGAGPGEVVTFQLFNSPGFALVYLAAQRVGAIAAPLNFRFSPGETAYVLDDSLPRVHVVDESLLPMTSEALALARHIPGTVVTVPAPGSQGTVASLPAPAVAFADLLASDGPVPEFTGGSAWDESCRLYTSGTTGMPKGVPLPPVAEVLTAHDVIMHFPLTPGDRTLNMTPWFHRGGISPGGPNAVFYAGAAAVPMRAFDAAAVLDAVAAYQLTFLIGAPTNLAMLAGEQETRPRELSSLRGIVTMGAPLERTACLRYQDVLTPRIFNGYGTTEAFWNTFLQPADLPAHAGTAGRACTDDDVRIVHLRDGEPADPADPVPQDGATIGEVVMRSVKSGYAYVNNPAEQQARFRDGWVFTGDLATWDADAYVTIVGRKDDMIITGGENVYPVQVEEVLNAHPLISDCAVVGLPDPKWGQIVVAYVVPSGPGLTAAECDRHCRRHPMLASYKRPRGYRFVADLPRTATGKKMHYKIRDTARDTGSITTFDQP
jgi:acyl-coenzyme A synthetase/AMP-(fatty) acid ligase